jgi:adenylosuccinate lyase
MLTISPLDSRYKQETEFLLLFFSENAILKLKTEIELAYYNEICKKLFNSEEINFEINDSILSSIIEIESKTKHDIKAIELALAKHLSENYKDSKINYLHFGLTSQDINSLSTSVSIKRFLPIYIANINNLLKTIEDAANERFNVAMLARTHGQPAVITSMRKELLLFSSRVKKQLDILSSIKIYAKFGGAVGNLSAHYFAYPNVDWTSFMDGFVSKYDIERQTLSTQVDNNDWLSLFFSICANINNIFIDFCKDMWMYYSYDYFKTIVTKEEVGSSTMPQKINPISFENAEGNLEFANSMFEFMSRKFQVSRMQRDLTDTTVIRNIGVPFGHTSVAIKSMTRGVLKISANTEVIRKDILSHPEIIGEGIQTLLRAENHKNPYEIVKMLVRNSHLDIYKVTSFLRENDVSNESINKILALYKNPEFYLENIK